MSDDPVQVLLGVDHRREEAWVRCHSAEIIWIGHERRVTPGRLTGDGQAQDVRDWLAGAVAEAQRLRRRRFRWCPLCRTLSGPEDMDSGICHACMTEYLGVVF